MKFLVVGCGLTGAVAARLLAEEGHDITIWERRDHIGGNMYDFVDDNGYYIQKYGPHTFHTYDKELYNFMCKYSEWDEYFLTCGAVWDDSYTPTPFNFTTIDTFYPKEKAEELKKRLNEKYPNQETVTVVEALESEDLMIKEYAQYLFEKDYRPYSSKQWGKDPSEIDPSILKRVPLRLSYKDGYFDDTYQVMPRESFTQFFENLLDHENIGVVLNIDALNYLTVKENKILIGDFDDIHVIFTGALDELFDNVLGRLPYRSLTFDFKYENVKSFQPAPVVAYPQEKEFVRITEYTKLPVQDKDGTVYAVEYSHTYDPEKGMEPYYPVLTEDSINLYTKYKEMADRIVNLTYCGRLADFKYYNMDKALERVLNLMKEKITSFSSSR